MTGDRGSMGLRALGLLVESELSPCRRRFRFDDIAGLGRRSAATARKPLPFSRFPAARHRSGGVRRPQKVVRKVPQAGGGRAAPRWTLDRGAEGRGAGGGDRCSGGPPKRASRTPAPCQENRTLPGRRSPTREWCGSGPLGGRLEGGQRTS